MCLSQTSLLHRPALFRRNGPALPRLHACAPANCQQHGNSHSSLLPSVPLHSAPSPSLAPSTRHPRPIFCPVLPHPLYTRHPQDSTFFLLFLLSSSLAPRIAVSPQHRTRPQRAAPPPEPRRALSLSSAPSRSLHANVRLLRFALGQQDGKRLLQQWTHHLLARSHLWRSLCPRHHLHRLSQYSPNLRTCASCQPRTNLAQLAWVIAFVSSILSATRDNAKERVPPFAWWTLVYMLSCIVGVAVTVASDSERTYHVAVSTTRPHSTPSSC